jgi:proton-translocating NADH-quinone oxidoreductase chain N
MWPITVMELLFGGGMLSLLVDVLGRRSSALSRYGAGLAVASALVLSIVALAVDWSSDLGSVVKFQPIQEGLATLYVADRFTVFTALTVLVVGVAVAAYSLQYFDGPRQGPFYALLSILVCSLVGVVSAGDLITLFLFWEGMAISGYGLVTFGRSELSMEAGIKYFLMAGVGSLFVLYGISVVYFATGSILLQTVGSAMGTGLGQMGVVVLLLGLGVEAAVVPLHTWLPDVYSASTLPTAAVVSGAVTGVGVFAILKVIQPLVPGGGIAPAGPLGSFSGLQIVLAALAIVTMLVGNLSALGQGNLRRMLSFSSVAQTGYMLAALSTLSVAGLVAVVFTIWNHGLLKSNFFMAIGKDNSALEASRLDTLRGAGRGNRKVGFIYASSSLAMTGAPPFGMFWSEILIVDSLLLAGQGSGSIFYVLAAAVVLNIVLSAGYYFRVVNTVVFGETSGKPDPRGVADLIPSASLLALSLLTGIAPILFLGWAL